MRMLVTCLAAMLRRHPLGRGEAEPGEAAARVGLDRAAGGARVLLALQELCDDVEAGGLAGLRAADDGLHGAADLGAPGGRERDRQQVDEEAGGEVLAGVLVADAQRVEQALPLGVAGELDHLDAVGDLGQVGPAVVALGVDVAHQRALQGGEEHQVLQQHRLARARACPRTAPTAGARSGRPR